VAHDLPLLIVTQRVASFPAGRTEPKCPLHRRILQRRSAAKFMWVVVNPSGEQARVSVEPRRFDAICAGSDSGCLSRSDERRRRNKVFLR